MIDSMMSAFGALLSGFSGFVVPNLWWIIPALVLVLVVTFPMPGRGPISSTRDPWRGFKFGPRAEVFARAGNRCEASAFIAWGRCPSEATEVDHVYAWSRGGPTVASNGQALCSAHNRAKRNSPVPWWYISVLEKRRVAYFPPGSDVRVLAVMNAADLASRAASVERRVRRR